MFKYHMYHKNTKYEDFFFKERKTTTTKIIKIQFRGLPPFFAACVRLKFIDAKNQKIITHSEFFFAGMVQLFLKNVNINPLQKNPLVKITSRDIFFSTLIVTKCQYLNTMLLHVLFYNWFKSCENHQHCQDVKCIKNQQKFHW